ncbi:MAG: rhodanese-like domain-containing protein [Bacteroidales bacterium]|nr:rhodanese-like domain-containing protein [Bacteroidales bacterium]
MNELNKTLRLTIAVVAIALVFVIGLLTFQKPEVEYKLTPDVALSHLTDVNLMVNVEQAQEIIRQNDANMIFIDVRNPISFGRDHIEKAINIPLRELLDKSSLKLLRSLNEKGKTMVIYGETPQQASGAWMMLQQTGFQNTKMLNGSYTELGSKSDKTAAMFSETPMIDMEALKTLTSAAPVTEVQNTPSAKKTVIPAKVETSKGGGC